MFGKSAVFNFDFIVFIIQKNSQPLQRKVVHKEPVTYKLIRLESLKVSSLKVNSLKVNSLKGRQQIRRLSLQSL